MRKSFKFRIYPTKSQKKEMEKTLDLCRWTYNKTLAYRKDVWEKESKHISKYDTFNLLPVWKAENPELVNVHSQVLQNVQDRVDLAYRSFFRRVKNGEKPGYPRFKGKGWYDSFIYPQSGFNLTSGKLRLSKIGDIKIKLHRKIEGDIKQLTIRKTSTGKWFVSFSVDVKDSYQHSTNNGSVVGVDVGLESFVTLSTGEKIENPRFFRSEEKALVKAQRRLSKCEKGTSKRKKALKVVRRVHERITNRRYNFAHQISNRLIKKYRLIVFEDLNITKMLKTRRLAKSISDVSWRMLVTVTSYKAESAGSIVVLVDPKDTSKVCSRCGNLVEKLLSDRVHDCPFCGLVMDRDKNAAINILRLGLQSLPKARSPALKGGE